MDVTQVASAIKDKITLLEKYRGRLRERAEMKAKTIAEYDKALAIEMVRFKDEYGATMSEKLAKGSISEKRYEMEVADAMYRSLHTAIDCIIAELNGWQSLNRHMSEV